MVGAAGYGVGGGRRVAPETSLSCPCPTHAEMVARLHELYASEKRLTKKGQLEKANAKVLEEEEGVAKVDGELQGVKDQMKAHLKEEEERKERRRREEGAGGDDMDDSAFALRKLACGLRLGRGGRLAGRGVFLEAGWGPEVGS